MENFGEVSSNPQLIRLDELAAKKELLETQIQRDDFVDPSIKGAYVEAHANLGTEIVAMTDDETVRQELESIRDDAEKGLAQLNELAELTDGVADPTLREEFESRIDKVSSYIGEKSIASTVEQPSPASPDNSEVQAQGEQVRTDVRLTVSNTGVDIGEEGEHVLFDKRSNPDQTSYESERRTALIHIISHQGEEIKQEDVWQAIRSDSGHSDEDYAKVMKNVRSWLTNLKFNKLPLIDHNGERGAGATFTTLEQFQFELEVKEEEAAKEPEVELPEYEQIISTKDMALVAHKLSLISGVLESYGFPAVDNDLLTELTRLANNVNDPTYNDEKVDIETKRERAVERIQDPDLLEQYIEAAEEDSPQYLFVEYFLDLECAADSKDLMRRLINSKIESSHVIERGSRYKGSTAVLRDSETGEVLWPRESDEEESGSILSQPPARPGNAVSDNGEKPVDEDEPSSNGEVVGSLSGFPGKVIEAVSEGASKLRRRPEREERIKKRMEPIRESIEEITTRFFESFDDPDEQLQLAALSQAFGNGLRQKLVDYDKANKITYKGQEEDKYKLDLRKLIKVKLYGDRRKDRNFLLNHEKNIDEAVEEIIKEALERSPAR